MTYLIPQSKLVHLTHTELRLILSQIFNELAKLQQFPQGCPLAPDDAENIKEYLRRRKQNPNL